jgi:hypothetical protein
VSLGEVEEILGAYIQELARGDINEDDDASSARVAVGA